MATKSNLNVQMLEHTRTIEANQVNVYEFHLSGINDTLGKLQKKLDAELHDAQEDENNAADSIFFNSLRGTFWCPTPDDASKRMALAATVQEEFEFMRQLKIYLEVPDDLVLKAGEPQGFEAYRLLLRWYEPQTTATAVRWS